MEVIDKEEKAVGGFNVLQAFEALDSAEIDTAEHDENIVTEDVKPTVPSKIEIRHEDGEVYGANTWEQFSVINKDTGVILYAQAEADADEFEVDIDWEEDGPATYVPYGETSVLYDDGRGGVDGVSVDGSVDSVEFMSQENGENGESFEPPFIMSYDDATVALDLTPVEFKNVCIAIENQAAAIICDYLEEYYEENPPERDDDDYWPEPDYYD